MKPTINMEHMILSRIKKSFTAWSTLGAVCGLVAALAAPQAHAGAYTYSTRERTINAGVLVLGDPNSGNLVTQNGQTFGMDPDPYVFYILNQREDIKPFGWNIVNPLAPRIVTGSILARWNAQTSGGATLSLDQTITPKMGAYWEVPFTDSTSLTDLEQFNVLLINIQGRTISFTDNEVNNLRRYVDNGGQLWIEDSGTGSISTTNPLFLNMTFLNGNSGTIAPGNVILPATDGLFLHQPVIGSPYLLSPDELNSIGNQPAHQQAVVDLSGNAAPDPGILSTVLALPNDNDLPVVAAGQFGAGQVIVDAVGSAASINNSVGGISGGLGPNSGPYCGTAFANAASDDLEFVSDILSWSASHPNPHKTSHQSSESPNTLGPALSPAWTFAVTPASSTTSATPTPGAAINGSFVYVRGADGVLRCFNATPGTDIIGTGNPDAGMPDYVNGTPYDQIWNTSGVANGLTPYNSFAPITPATFTDANGSGPMITETPDGKTTLFIEDAQGQVYDFDATTGAAGGYGGGMLGGGGGGVAYGAGGIPGPAPSPTYYDGRVYAGQANGTLFVYDCRTGKAETYTLASAATSEYVTEPPTVGIVHEILNPGGYSDDLVATVTTNIGTYTLQAGAFHDHLTGSGSLFTPNPANALSAGPNQFQIDPYAPYSTYDDNGAYQNPLASTPSGSGFNLTTLPPAGTLVFGDYNVDFSTGAAGTAGSPAGSLTRNLFGTTSSTPTPAAYVSPPALDANGNYYYVMNVPESGGLDSTLVCAHDSRFGDAPPPGRFTASQLQWRFRLPYASEVDGLDADGVSYQALDGFHFVGAPVVDTQGDVYALATNGTEAAVLCFNATGEIYIHLPVNSTQGSLHVSSLAQPVPGGLSDEFGNATATPISGIGTQYNGFVDGNGNMQLQSFGSFAGSTLNPNLSEPQPVQATYTLASNGSTSTNTVPATMHTNLTWFAILPAGVLPNFPTSIAATPSLTLVGDYLFFADANGFIYRVFAYPQDTGQVDGFNRTVVLTQANVVNGVTVISPVTDSQGRPLVAAIQANVGPINGVLSAGNNILVANGVKGIAAFGSSYDLVADATRVMEVDSEGVATWMVDGTSEANPATGLTTHVALNHPRDITQVTANDYLVADTGNNRCVRFNRAGDVIWELSRFNDLPLEVSGTAIPFYNAANGKQAIKTAPLLAPGEPLTLNHPTSVSSYVQTIKNSSGVLLFTVVHYLVADTGNDRIVEVVDVFDGKGNPVGPPHDLVWVSRTYDALGRKYAYTSANYFVGPGGLEYIAALVKNVRIAAVPSPGRMQSASADAPGSSIVLLDYDPALANSSTQDDGYISHTISAFLSYGPQGGPFDLAAAPKEAAVGSAYVEEPATIAPTLVYLRSPQFLQTYTPPGGQGAIQNFLLADDNGVFDLHLDPTGADSGATTNPGQYANYFEAQWGMTPADYQNLETFQSIEAGSPQLAPVNGSEYPSRADIPFLPNSIQRTTTDTVADNGTNYLIGHYIITNGYSSGQVTPYTGFGGEVAEVAVPSGTMTTGLVSAFGELQGNNAAPLSQPTYAGREK